MPVRIESGAEPIPGYKLIERLGGGGFGEVWKVLAPGGLLKAIKFVYGDLQAIDDEDGSRAKQELKALNRVKSVHHPYILSLERLDIIDGQLMITMELADRTLWDRFRECRNQGLPRMGLPGIPRAELLGYLEETAEALDLMNDQYKLQHLDIKPQNLFLVFNHVKVADFGLVKDLEGMAATVTGGVTPVYAAPETFDGWVSRSSDQYSLGIVYQELLTGQRPFSGSSIRQLVMQHMEGTPDLSSLLRAERSVVSRALSKNHEHRFPTCLEFIKALRQAVGNVQPCAASPASASGSETSREPLPAFPEKSKNHPGAVAMAEDSLLDPARTRNARGRLAKPKVSESEISRAESVPLPMAPLPPRPPKQPASKPAACKPASRPHAVAALPPASGPETGQLSDSLSAARCCLARPEDLPFSDDGTLRPALVVGLGRVGLDILKNLRRELTENFGSPLATPHLRFLYVDTDPEAAQDAMRGTADALESGEILLTRLHRPSHYLRPRDGKIPFDSWLSSKVLYCIPKQQNHAGVRALGRLAYVDNYSAIQKKLEAELTACTAPAALEQAAQASGLPLRTRLPRVFVVTSLAGGTGSGMFIDLAYLARRLLKQLGFEDGEIIGLFLLPPAAADPAAARGLANAYAALAELQHFAGAEAIFTAKYEPRETEVREKCFQEKGPPFQRCLFLPLPEKRGRDGAIFEGLPSDSLVRAGYYLFCDLISPLGRIADNMRRKPPAKASAVGQAVLPVPPTPAGDEGAISYDTFGMQRISWPCRPIRLQAARRLGSRLLQHWMSKDVDRLRDVTQPWAQEQWETLGFRPESLIARLQEKCAAILTKPPETLWSEVINPLADLFKAQAQRNPDDPVLRWTPLVQAVESLEKLLGAPGELQSQNLCPGARDEDLSMMEQALRETGSALALECEQLLAELVVRLFEEPAFRLAGAEEAVRQFSSCLKKALESQEPLLRELQEQTVVLYKRVHGLLESPLPVNHSTPMSRWRAPFTRRPNPEQAQAVPELLDLLRSYAKCRYHFLILQSLNTLYVSLRGQLSDQMREISFCRQRLIELADLVREPAAAKSPANVPAQKLLLPQCCATLEDAVRHVDAGIAEEDLLAFDGEVQEIIRQQFRALVNVCLASTTVIRSLSEALLLHAEKFLEQREQGTDAAELFLAQYSNSSEDRARLEESLRNAYEDAAPRIAPEIAKAGNDEVFIISAPAGEAGDRFRQLAQELFPEALLVASVRSDEILFFRGLQSLTLADLGHLGPEAQEAYRQRLAQDPIFIHSRADITEWRSALAVS